MSKWKRVKLEQIAQISAGQSAPQGANNYSDNGIPFIKAGNLEFLVNGGSELDVQKVNESVAKSHNLKLFNTGTIVFAKSGMSCMKGHVHILKNGCYVVNHLACVTPININNNYLKFYFMFQRPNKLVKDSAYPSISLSDISLLQIPLPPLETQKQIAKTLDAVSELLSMRKQQLAELDNLIKSVFYDMFGDLKTNQIGWEIKNFNDVAYIDTNMTTNFEAFADYPHIGIDSIEKSTGEIIGYKLVKESNLISGKYIFSDKHIIYSKIRPNLNKVALPSFSGLCSADAYPIRVKDNITNKYYLAYVMRSDFFLNYILDFSGRTNIPKVNKQQIEGFKLPLPSIDIQNQFAIIVTKIEAQKSLVKKAIAETQLLFDSLMSQYFD